MLEEKGKTEVKKEEKRETQEEAKQNSCLHNKTHNMKSLVSPIFKVHVLINLETL